MVSIESPVVFQVNPVLKSFSNISLILNISVLVFFVFFLVFRHFNKGTPRDFREYIPSQAVDHEEELDDIGEDHIDNLQL